MIWPGDRMLVKISRLSKELLQRKDQTTKVGEKKHVAHTKGWVNCQGNVMQIMESQAKTEWTNYRQHVRPSIVLEKIQPPNPCFSHQWRFSTLFSMFFQVSLQPVRKAGSTPTMAVVGQASKPHVGWRRNLSKIYCKHVDIKSGQSTCCKCLTRYS